MRTTIVVHPRFDEVWPFAADRLHELLQPITEVTFTRLEPGATSDGDPTAERLFWLGAPLDAAVLDQFPGVREVFATEGYRSNPDADALLEDRGIRRLDHGSEGYWAQSVSEFALGLTIGALRRIPQTHHAMLTDPTAWDYPAEQFGDDPAFANGTVEGKRVRIVGAGNIASRYASFVNMLGADVAAWDPFASDPSFHRAGSRREYSLAHLALDAEIFAPMVPLTPGTEGIVTADIIRSLPNGCLVVLATRARVCDVPELRRRVLADELSLAADVFDLEPVPFDDPLLGRHNVVHTPHNAGRTIDSNLRWAELLVAQLDEFDPGKVPPASVRR
jgi:phosphoglycerate dehydrogenase-like enzyme